MTKRVVCRKLYREILLDVRDGYRAERDERNTDEHGFRAAYRTMRQCEIQTLSAHSETAMGPPITAEKCCQALAETLFREDRVKRSGNTVKYPSS